jgi:serine/threonine protein kinase
MCDFGRHTNDSCRSLIVRTHGHVLGFAKKIDRAKAYTLCGTPEFLAPEIILGRGYNMGGSYSINHLDELRVQSLDMRSIVF